MQFAFTLRDRELVIRLGEMVHADVDVARAGQSFDRKLEDRKLGFRRWELGLVDAPLRFEQVRHVGVAVQGDAVRRRRDHLLQCRIEAPRRLAGEPVDQVDI